VVAGPGSGKTTVLVEYFRRLVAGGVDPLRILAITFTEKAAGNMRKKLAQAFRDDCREIRAQTGARLGLDGPRILRAPVAGECRLRGSRPGVPHRAEGREAWRMQQESIAAAIERLFQEHPARLRALIRGLSSYEFEEAVLSAYDTMRGAGVRVEELARLPGSARRYHRRDRRHDGALRRRAGSRTWSEAQRQQLESHLEGAERIVTAARAAAKRCARSKVFRVQSEQVQDAARCV
jgi:hypothetical protein